MKSNATQRRFLYSWWMIPLSVLLLLVLVSAGAWAYFQGKLDRINFVGDADPLTDAAEQTGSLSDLEYLNVLLLGTDERTPGGSSTDFSADLLTEARSDACMVLNLNLKQHTAALVSLERAIGVSIEGHGQDWLTHVFAYGGANLMLKTVREQLGVDVRRYLRVNVSAAAQLIDAIGGVDLTLTKMEAAALNGEVYTNAVAHTRVKEGLNHLDGFDTMAYARQRFIDDDFHRVQRQRNVIQAAIDQTKELSLKQINHLLDEVLPLVETNLSKKEISALVLKAPSFLGVQLRQMTLPLHGMYGAKKTADGRSLMMLDPQEAEFILQEFLHGEFDPATYEASKEVQDRVWAAQKKANAEWAAAHPAPPPVTSDHDSVTFLEDAQMDDEAPQDSDEFSYMEGSGDATQNDEVTIPGEFSGLAKKHTGSALTDEDSPVMPEE